MEVRCGSKMHGILLETGLLEIKCDSKFCGAGAGVTVLHRFDISTGDLVETHRYKDPGRNTADATDNHPPAVRSA